MGVDRSDWIVIGVDIGMEHYDDDLWLEDDNFYDTYSGKSQLGDMTFLIDGMRGNYFIVGEVLLHVDEYEGFGLSEFPLAETNEFNDSATRVREFIKEKFKIEDVEPKLIVLTHFT